MLVLLLGGKCAKVLQANKSCSPLLLSILHGEGAEGGRGYYLLYRKNIDLQMIVDKVYNTLFLLHHTSQFISLTTSLEVEQKTPPKEALLSK